MAVCIFCGGRPISKEHTWAKWLRQYVPMSATDHNESLATIGIATIRQRIARRRSGDLRRRGVKCVCEQCNNGWMSAMQNVNKEVLVSLATGKSTLITVEQQINLAAWIAIFATCSEYRTPERATVSQAIRTLLWKKQVAPPTWGIWIGHHKPSQRWRSYLKHFTLRFSNDLPQGTAFDPKIYPLNSHITTFRVGNMFSHVIGTNVDQRFVIGGYSFTDGEQKLLRIWPATQAIFWNPPPALTDEEADRIGNEYFQRFSGQPV